jgi:D-arabinose 1-dehydrogenase-like Zn-dependent alcohol dehydrogenase
MPAKKAYMAAMKFDTPCACTTLRRAARAVTAAYDAALAPSGLRITQFFILRRLARLRALGGAKVILITASGGKTVAATFKGLRPGGVSINLGVGPEPIEVTSMDLIFGSRKLEGALTGDPATGDATLRFSALSGVSAMIETVPLKGAAAAYAKMMAGEARFRIVLTMD